MSKNKTVLLYGRHASIAALKNEKRKVRKIYVTKRAFEELPRGVKLPTPKIMAMKDFDKLLPSDATHQGIAIEVDFLPEASLKDAANSSETIMILDQVTDPHNVGAIMRSCAAFGCYAIIVPKDNSFSESAIVAKSASGALEEVKICRVTNLTRAMDQLKKEGFWIVGMDGNTDTTIDQANLSGKNAIVMGAEGRGLRRLTKDSCDSVVKLPISPRVESLNVSNAAAIVLYEAYKGKI